MARRLSKQKTREKVAEETSDEGTRYTADPRSTGLRWDVTQGVAEEARRSTRSTTAYVVLRHTWYARPILLSVPDSLRLRNLRVI